MEGEVGVFRSKGTGGFVGSWGQEAGVDPKGSGGLGPLTPGFEASKFICWTLPNLPIFF